MTATLRIGVDGGADIKRSLGIVAADAKKANNSMGADARQRAALETRLAQERIKAEARVTTAQIAAHARVTATQVTAMTKLRAARIAQEAADARADATKVQRAEQSAAKRIKAEERVTRAVTSQLRTRLQAHLDTEQTIARATRRAEQSRTTRPGAGGGGGSGLGSALGGVVRGIHGDIQDTRQRRAAPERELGVAMYTAGANRTQVRAGMEMFSRFAADRGIPLAELTQAAVGAQSFANVLGTRDSTPEARQGAMRSFLADAAMARNTGNDVAQYTRLSGMLRQQGVDDNTRQSLMLFAGGAAQRGAVELDSVSREAMPAIMARMNQAQSALGPNASQEERTNAARGAFGQSLAELEVAASIGIAPGRAGNALRDAGNALGGNVTQQRILHNIRSTSALDRTQRARLEGALFEQDPAHRGRMRLRSTDALAFAETFGQTVGNDGAMLGNVFRGGGHGNPQGLQKNWRDILGGLLTTDTEGHAAYQRARELMDPAHTSLTMADANRGANIFENDSLSQLTRNQETHDNALGNNTGALNQLSNRINDFLGRNPMVSQLTGAAAPALGAMLMRGGGAGLGRGSASAAAARGWASRRRRRAARGGPRGRGPRRVRALPDERGLQRAHGHHARRANHRGPGLRRRRRGEPHGRRDRGAAAAPARGERAAFLEPRGAAGARRRRGRRRRRRGRNARLRALRGRAEPGTRGRDPPAGRATPTPHHRERRRPHRGARRGAARERRHAGRAALQPVRIERGRRDA
jgi:hypothetical protein